MLLFGRRAFIGSLSGAALIGAVGALAQSGGRRFDLESILSQYREGPRRYVLTDPHLPFENISFTRWELRNRVFVEDFVTRGARNVLVTRFEADGSFVSADDRTRTRGRFNPDGSASFEGESAGLGVSGRIEFIGGGRIRVTTRLSNGVTGAMESELVAPDEARRIAARLYPAEYALASPPTFSGGSPGPHAAGRGRGRVSGQVSQGQGHPRPPAPPSAPTVRSALVIGAGHYAGLPVLANPPNDARAMARGLTGLGYEVDLLIDPDRAGIVAALGRIRNRRDTSSGQAEVFYYAGHAIEIRGRNFLLGVDMPLAPTNIENQAIPLDTVIGELSADRISTRILILDACRNGPARWPGMGQGLAQISAAQGTYVAYSTAPGMVALDGDGQNSPFTLALVNELARPSQPIEAVFRSVRRSVVGATAGQQIPWDSSSLVEPFSFAAG
jgi:hypothetical protein